MGEWVWSKVMCLKKDREVFAAQGYNTVEDEGEDWVELSQQQTNYGNTDEFMAMKGKGIPFLAWNGSLPGAVDSLLIACDGQDVAAAQSDDEEWPTVRVQDDGTVLEGDLHEVHKYQALRSRAGEMLGWNSPSAREET